MTERLSIIISHPHDDEVKFIFAHTKNYFTVRNECTARIDTWGGVSYSDPVSELEKGIMDLIIKSK